MQLRQTVLEGDDFTYTVKDRQSFLPRRLLRRGFSVFRVMLLGVH